MTARELGRERTTRILLELMRDALIEGAPQGFTTAELLGAQLTFLNHTLEIVRRQPDADEALAEVAQIMLRIMPLSGPKQ